MVNSRSLLFISVVNNDQRIRNCLSRSLGGKDHMVFRGNGEEFSRLLQI